MAAPMEDEEISEEFSMFGVELSNDDVMDKVKELCIAFSKDACGIVEEWVAFSQSTRTPMCDVNLDNLTRFEREMDKKKGSKSTPIPLLSTTPRTPKFRNIQPVNDGDDVLSSYASPAGKGSKRQLTPDNTSVKRGNFASPVTLHLSASPVAFSPANAKLSESYKARSGSGDTIASLNIPQTISWKGQGPANTTIGLHPDCLNDQYKYMFQKNIEKIDVLDEIIEDIRDRFHTQLQLLHGDDFEFAHATLPAQEQVTIVGRIACDSNGKLNAKSVVLEGSRDNSGGRTVALDLSGLEKFSLFPGQIVAMEGMNTSGSQFVVKKVLDQLVNPCVELGEVEGPFSILVACGPFSTIDSLAYEPLEDLLQVIEQQAPDVCIIMGPFIDEKNDALGTLTELTFEELFKKQIQSVLSATKDLETKLVFVPSSRDVHHAMVYPQPPYQCPEITDERVLFVSDPTLIRINNVTIGLTSTDALFHLGQQELSFGMVDKIPRLVRHLLQQQKFYPMYPPGEDVNLDLDKFITYARLPLTPNVLLLPSRLTQFAKDISGCCCVNPGTLSRGKSAGSYAQILVRAADSGKSSVENISVKVVKI